MSAHGLTALPFWLALAGHRDRVVPLHVKNTHLPKKIAIAFGPLYALVERKYGFDELYALAVRRAARG